MWEKCQNNIQGNTEIKKPYIGSPGLWFILKPRWAKQQGF
jgi:hypothetical protein